MMMMRWLKSRLKRCLLFASFLSVVFVLSLCLLSAANRAQLRLITPVRSQAQAPLVQFYPDNQIRLAAARNRLDGGKKIEDLPPPPPLKKDTRRHLQLTSPNPVAPNSLVSTDVHIFYYGWYANPQTDGQWVSRISHTKKDYVCH